MCYSSLTLPYVCPDRSRCGIPLLVLFSQIVPRQRRCVEALQVVNDTLDDLIAKCKKLVEEEDEEFVEEFLSEADPSILHFLLAS